MLVQDALFADDATSGAVIDGPFRYTLWRTWASSLPLCGWVMLNPSTATALSVVAITVDAWASIRLTIFKPFGSTSRASTCGKSHSASVSRPTLWAEPFAAKASIFEMVARWQLTISKSRPCMWQARPSMPSPTNCALAASWCEQACSARGLSADSQRTTVGSPSTQAKRCACTRRPRVQKRSHAPFACQRTRCCEHSMSKGFAHVADDMCSRRTRSNVSWICIGTGERSATLGWNFRFHSAPCVKRSGFSTSIYQNVAVPSVRVRFELARTGFISAFALTTQTRWPACVRRVDSCLNTASSWRGTSDVPCCLAKLSITSTTTGTTTGSRTCSYESVSMVAAMHFSAPTADLIEFSLRRLPDPAPGLAGGGV